MAVDVLVFLDQEEQVVAYRRARGFSVARSDRDSDRDRGRDRKR